MDLILTLILAFLEVIAVGIVGFKFTYDIAYGIDILNKHPYNQEDYMKDEDEKDE